MADFTLSRTAEDQDNEQFTIAYSVNDVETLEKNSLLVVAATAWRHLDRDPGKAPSAASFRSLLDMTPSLAAQTHAVRFMVSGVEFQIDDAGRNALQQVGIAGDLDLAAQELNRREFASFLFIASSATTPTYQRVCEICNGVRREYARLALPVDDGGESLAYFMIRPLNPSETPLEQIRQFAEMIAPNA